MKTVQRYQTNDGHLHDSQTDALKHLDAIYTNEICKLACNIVAFNKYQDVKDFLNNNLHNFVNLYNIKEDMKLIEQEDE